MRYQLIVFDWDGTLMDSETRIVTCIQQAARDADMPVPDHDIAKEIIGLGLQEALAQLFPDHLPEERNQLLLAYRRHWMGDELPGAPVFDGVEMVLQGLESAGYLLAVATGKSRTGLDKALNDAQLGHYFAATRCADEAFSKPHPQILLDVLELTGVDAADALMIGDTEYDIEMANNAKVASLGVDYGVHGRERLLAKGALASLADIKALPQWLSQVR